MSDTTETAQINVTGTLQQFNRYGLPGLVIGVQFLIIAGILYFVLTVFQNNIRAMTEMTGALRELKTQIQDCREAKYDRN